MANKSGIHIKPENKGKFTATKKRTGKSTEELTHSKNPLTRKRAIFAQNAKKWHHEMGGLVNPLLNQNQLAWGQLIQQVSGAGDQVGQAIGGGFGDTMSGMFKPEKGFAVLKRDDVAGWKKAASFLAPGLGNMWAKKAQKEEQENAMKKAQVVDSLSKMPPSAQGVVPGVANPYMLAFGGLTNSNNLETYNTGGTHDQNPLGGIPLNQGANGNMNTVEEGESSFNFSDGKYVFSNRLNLGEVTDIGLPDSVKNKTFSEASKHIEKLFKGRNGRLDISTKKSMMSRLREAQEGLKQEQTGVNQESGELAYGGLNKYSGEEPYPSLLTNAAYGTVQNPLESSVNNMTTGIQTPSTNITNTTFAQNRINAINPALGNSVNNNNNNTNDSNNDSWLQRNQGLLGNVGAIGLMAAPIIGNEIMKRNLKPSAPVNPRTVESQFTPQLVNTQQVERNLVGQLAGNRQALQSVSSGDFGQYASNLQSLNAGTSGALANATLQANLANAQERSRVEQGNIGLEQFNAQQLFRADDLDAQNMAAYETQKNLYNQATVQNLANVGQTLWNYKQSKGYTDSMSKVMQFLGLQQQKTT